MRLAGQHNSPVRVVDQRRVELGFKILMNAHVRKYVSELEDLVFNTIRFSLSLSNMDKIPSSKELDFITDTYYQPWARQVLHWLLVAGVAPYYVVPLHKMVGCSAPLLGSGLRNQPVPVCPLTSEGYISTYKEYNNIGPQRYEWHWFKGGDEVPANKIVFIEDYAVTPDPFDGKLRSLMSTIIPEFMAFTRTYEQMLVTEDLRTMPPFILGAGTLAPPQSNMYLPGGFIDTTGRFDEQDSREIRESFVQLTEWETEVQTEAIQRAATQVFAANWDHSATPVTQKADEKWDLWKKRRWQLPKNCRLEKSAVSDGITRAEFDTWRDNFEATVACVLGVGASAAGHKSASRSTAYDHQTLRALAATAQNRKRQFAAIIAGVFASSNWELFEQELVGMGVYITGKGRKKAIASIATIFVSVDLGQPVLLSEEGQSVMGPKETPVQIAPSELFRAAAAENDRATKERRQKRKAKKKAKKEATRPRQRAKKATPMPWDSVLDGMTSLATGK